MMLSDPSTRDRSREPMMTSDFLEFHAHHRPSTIALIERDRRITYAEFHRDRVRATRGLRQLGLPAGTKVAVACGELYLEWLLLLAGERLGLVMASFALIEGVAAGELWSHVDLVLSDAGELATRAKRFHQVTPQWIAGLERSGDADQEDDPLVVLSGDDAPLRITRSSGTTGGQKLMILTKRYFEGNLHDHFLAMRATPSSVYLIAHPFSVGANYARATICLRLGATCITKVFLRDLAALGCTHAWSQPVGLEQWLNDLPPGFVKPPNLRLETGGAPLPAALRARALREFASEISHSYAANEVGWIGPVGPDGVVTLLPGVEAEIVDDQGAALPPGKIGTVRVRTPGMIDGYLDNPEATARTFWDGWFQSGDAGTWVGHRRLTIMGRTDELLNLGGIKVVPDEIEQHVRRLPGIVDVGVTLLQHPGTAFTLGVAYVRGPGAGAVPVEDSIRKLLPFPNLRFATKEVDRLPRTETGKLRRHALKDMFV